MSRPRKHSDSHLVGAAARAIARRGPNQLTLADVADEAGVAPATLVQRFGSKRDLLLAVAASGPEHVGTVFAEARARRASPVKTIEAALLQLASGVTDPDEIANHLAFLALDLADPEFRGHAAAHTEAMRHELDNLIQAAISAGELVPADRRGLADALQTAYHGTLFLWAIDRAGDPTARLRSNLRLVLRAYRPS